MPADSRFNSLFLGVKWFLCSPKCQTPTTSSRAFMHEASLSFLKSLLETPSPSGFERPVQDLVRSWAKPYADEFRTDRHGNVIAVRNPRGEPRIMLAGHCDQIALMVQYV